MPRKVKKCYEYCSAIVNESGKLLGSCIYIALPEKIVEKESEYPSTYPEELISLAVEDGELVIEQLTDAPVKAIITGFERFPESGPDEEIAISKEEFLAPLPDGEVNLDPLFFRKVPVSEVKSVV